MTFQFVPFRLGAELFWLEILHVQEVLEATAAALTPVPRTPVLIRGLINLRGDIVPVIDLRPALGGAPLPPPDEAMLLVVRIDQLAYALLIDAIHDVQHAPPRDWSPTPAHLPEAARQLVSGVYRLPDAIAMVLDARAVSRLIEAAYADGLATPTR